MKVVSATAFGLVCLIVYLGLQTKTGNGRESASVRFSTIGNAIQRYAYDHGNRLPVKLSDLVPEYVSADRISTFYPPYLRNSETRVLPADWNSKPELIDTFSDCVYLGPAGITHEAIAYERPGVWNRESGGRLHIIPPGGGVNPLSEPELNELLNSKSSSVLERMRKQRVMYYEANLHASLNAYRMDFGEYPRGDNTTVTGALRGDNKTKKDFHSSYEQTTNTTGEELDPWGTPYFFGSDGNTVKIKSAGGNREFDLIASSNFDDICITVSGGSVIGDGSKF